MIKQDKNLTFFDYDKQNAIVFNSDTLDFGLIKKDKIDYLKPIPLRNKKEEKNKRWAFKIVLNITSNCNMRCKYCYANYGDYNNNQIEEKEMSFQTIDSTLDFLTNQYDVIEKVLLFGGEPLLSAGKIKYIIEGFKQKVAKNKLKKLPLFGLVTNGTIMTPEVEKLIKNHKINMTVSLDGNAFINDQLRIFPNGKGNYKEAINFINKYRNNIGMIESTYTKIHQDNNITIEKLMEMIKKETGISNVYIATVDTDDKTLKPTDLSFINKYNKNSIIDNLKKIANHEDHQLQLLNMDIAVSLIFKRKIGKSFCEAAVSQLSFFVNGDFFPCYRFYEDNNFKLGNAKSDNKSFSENKEKFIKKYNSKQFDKCTNCFYQNLCSTCIAVGKTPVSDKKCQESKDLLKDLLTFFINLKKEGKFNQFKKGFSKWYKEINMAAS